jgi:monofunctional glycosyltransferase
MKRLFYKSLLLTLFVGLGAYVYSALPDVASLKKSNPKSTALIELRDDEYRRKGMRIARRQNWMLYEAISDHLKKAVLISEDASFHSHQGVDFLELKEAIKKDWETLSLKRGGSTITMQLARNLYLNPSKSPLRKLKEIIIAWQIEASLSKKRIFEIYLNVVEWGPGLYGADAASRHYFGVAASDLDEVQAAALAALLPSPRNPEEKSLRQRRNLILARMAQIGYIDEAYYIRNKEAPLF